MSISKKDWREALIKNSATIYNAIYNLNNSKLKIVLVLDETGNFQGTICDGDIRRGMLDGLDVNSKISEITNKDALVVPPEMKRELVKQLMTANNIQQIPIIDANGHVVGLHSWDEVIETPFIPNLMVIMAGGFGTRLKPYTENCPKPMLSVAGKPMLEHIINRAKLQGFSRFVISIYHLGDVIKEHFGCGESLGVQIDYIQEDTPLGTAGALGLLDKQPDMPFVVTNGDVITNIRYDELVDFHNKHSATATMAVRVHETQNPFGVVKLKEMEIVGFHEKPVYRDHINAGVYVLEPSALDYLTGQHCDMPQLFEQLRSDSEKIIAYPIHEAWIDVGKPEDYKTVKGSLDRATF